ncbi:MAG: EAL domain-containing protein [Motiliproteus sp.]
MTGTSKITPAETLELDPFIDLPSNALLKKAELDLFEWHIPQDKVEVTDYQGSLFNLSAGHFHGSTRSFLNRIHTEDRDKLTQQLRLVSRGADPMPITFRMRTTDGSLQGLTLSGQLVTSDKGLPLRMVGLLHSVSNRETSEDRLHLQQAALLQWAVSAPVTQGNIDEALKLISCGAAQVIAVERVSIWLFDDDHKVFRCAQRYQLSDDNYDSGAELDCSNYPIYIDALLKNKTIATTDARLDPLTSELCQNYLVPEGITSKLDVTIFRGGKPAGIISFEHTDLPRRWRVDERGFAISISDMISMLLEAGGRKEAESALNSQQQLLKDLMNNSGSLVYMRDLEGRYVLVNENFEELYGLTKEQLLNKTPMALFPKELAEQLMANDYTVFQSGEVQTFEEQTLHSDGIHSYFSVKFPVRDTHGEIYAIAGISTDITERIKTEAALKESELRHRTLFESALDAIVLIDNNDMLVDCNPAASELFGNDQLIGKSVLQLFTPEPTITTDDPTSLHQNWLSLNSDREQSFEQVCQRQNGSHFDAEISLSTMVLAGVTHRLLCIRDITVRKQRDEMVIQIAKGLSAETGKTFFRSLVEQLSKVLSADYALIGEICKNNPRQIQTLSAFAGGKEIDNFTYDLPDSPCEQVMASTVCVFTDKVQQRFPADNLLQEMAVEGYAGAALNDGNQAVGILVVLFKEPIKTPALFQNLLQIFAVRAAAELQRKSSEAALIASEERYRAFISNSGEGIWRAEIIPPVDTSLPSTAQVDQILSNYMILEANNALAEMHECTLEQLYSSAPEDFFGPSEYKVLIKEWVDNEYSLTDQEFQLKGKRDNDIWLSSSYSGVIENNQLVRIWGTRRNITEKKEYLSAIEYQAEHDALTHLPNRFWLSDHLRNQLKQKKYSQGMMALMLLDLDHFKEVNDSLGHHIGDQLLRLIGPRLSATLEQHNANLARLGGDEFAVVLNEVESAEAALAFADRISQSLHQPFELEGIQLEIHCSIGISLYPEHGEEPSSLMRCADVAMYLAKKSSKAFALYNSQLDEHSPRRLALMSELGQAIRENQLVLHYQPQLDLRCGKITGVEALVRWNHPTQGMIPPDQFIHLAEMGDLIRPLTLWVLDSALAQWRRWSEQGHELKVAVNLSTRNLMDDACPDYVKQMLEKHNAPANCLELEITESALIADPARALASLNEINDFGVELSIDDFGTGYSSLAYLKELPIDRLKIDMSFIRNMAKDKRDEMIVDSTIHLAHNLGLLVVAEGVEDQKSLDALTAMKCDFIQGYFIGRPVPPEELDLS